MNIAEALPIGTVIKLKEAEKRVVVMGIFQQIEEGDATESYDYIGVPYPEGFLGAESMVLFQQDDVETVFSLGFSDIERQSFVANMANESNEENTRRNA